MGLFEKGLLHALPYTRFEARDVIEAFRFMQQSQQIGKIVVTYRNGIPAENICVAEPQSAAPKGADLQNAELHSGAHQNAAANTPALKLDARACYLVTGGLGGFGLRSALWLAEKGARHLILLGRRGPDTAEARAGIETLANMGVKVSAYACDITDAAALANILESHLPALKGVIHAAAVIEDSLIANLSPAQFERVLSPKLTGALNLDRLTRTQALDFFVMYSSATTLFGNPGQAAYIAANCGLEALASQRRAQGLVATCMLWGAIDDAGFLARNKQVKEALQHRMGGQALSSAHALEQLEQAILHNHNNDGVLELDFAALAKFLPSAQSPRFSELARLGTQREQNDQSTEDIPRLLSELDDAALAVVFIEMVKHELSQILRIAPDKIDAGKSIYDMGLDSLMGVELVVALEARFGVRLSVMAISENPSIEKLTHRLIDILRAQLNTSDEAAQDMTSSSANKAQANGYDSQVAELVKLHGSDSSAEEIAALAESVRAQTHETGRFLK
jgi:NAD(P)-dependent dehydrogenase (short-subunit alcohol dehydrogenase family)/acyl carrier protein